MVMKKASDGDSSLRRVPERASGPFRSRVNNGGDLQYVSWKLIGLWVFLAEENI
jgi:hypothetical protein